MSSDSSDYSSSESEVEYEPIVVEDAEGKKMTMKEESNPLAPPVIIVNTNPTGTTDKSGKPKKSKVFASKDTMLSLIESVNNVQDGKIQAKLDRDASYLQRLKNIEKATQERKSMKHERLDKIKDNLRKGGIRVKGENKRIVRENHFKETAERESRNKSNGSRSGGKSNGKPSTRPSGGKPSTRPSGGKPSTRPSGGKPSARPSGPGAKPSGRTTSKPTSRPNSKPTGSRSSGKPAGKQSGKPSSGRPQKKVKFAV